MVCLVEACCDFLRALGIHQESPSQIGRINASDKLFGWSVSIWVRYNIDPGSEELDNFNSNLVAPGPPLKIKTALKTIVCSYIK